MRQRYPTPENRLKPSRRGHGGRVLTTLLIATTLVSLAAAATAGFLARKFYLQRSEVRLTPVNRVYYSRDNAELRAPAEPRIVFFGDSRITDWDPKPSLPEFDLVWRGIPGETTTQMRYRFEADALGLGANAIVIQAGINDLVLGAALGRTDEAVRMTIDNLAYMIQAAAMHKVTVYLMTIVRPARPALWRRPVWSDDIYGAIGIVNDTLRALSPNGMQLIDADSILGGTGHELPDNYALDTLHFTAAAYQRLNKELMMRVKVPLGAIQ